MEISTVNWNASGVVIGAGYARAFHESTCSHKSSVCLWGIFKRNFKPTKPDSISIPVKINLDRIVLAVFRFIRRSLLFLQLAPILVKFFFTISQKKMSNY